MKNITNISFDNLQIHPKNIRKDYGSLTELTKSINAKGIQNPLIVVPSPEDDGKYWVVAGNRRLLAGRKSDISEAPCIISDMDEQEQIESMIIENLQRKNLSIVEESQAYQMCLADYGMDIKTLSEKTGFSQRTIRRRVQVAKLDRDVLQRQMDNPEIQITFSILSQLERVNGIDARNRILEAATDEKDLACKIEQAVSEQNKAKILNRLKSMAKKIGIHDAPKEAYDNPYSGRWKIIKSLDPKQDLPDELLTDSELSSFEDGSLYCMSWYGKFRIIQDMEKDTPTGSPAEDEKEDAQPDGLTGDQDGSGDGSSGETGDNTPADTACGDDTPDDTGRDAEQQPEAPTEEELYRRQVSKNILLMNDLTAAMLDEMYDFFTGIIEGRFDPPEDMDALLGSAWDLLMHIEPDITMHAIASGITGQNAYNLDENAMRSVMDCIAGMPVALQMVAVAFWNCSGIRLCGDEGYRYEEPADILQRLYACLHLYGFTFSNEDYAQMLDGTCKLYTENWEEASEDDGWEVPDDGETIPFEDAA